MSHLRVAAHFSVGVFMGLLYADFGEDASKVIPNFGFLVTSLVYLFFTSMMSAILKCKYLHPTITAIDFNFYFVIIIFHLILTIIVVPYELSLVKKERFNNWYSLTTFYLAFVFVNIPLQVGIFFQPTV